MPRPSAVVAPVAAVGGGAGGAGGAPASPGDGRVEASPVPAVTPIPVDALQARLAALRKKYSSPGVSVTIIWPDGRQWTGVSGWANMRARVPVATTTDFAIGSVSKTFIAALMLQLAEEGKLSLDDRRRTCRTG
ncbi:MAG: beta-lactamase family protein [Chloroflexi bacterium]|nr:MAG: beta-lactamase family protein [Chloroflexota bacterium]